MYHGVIKINHSYINHALNLQIAKQCAPLISGIKISNLLITHSSNMKKVYEIFQHSPIRIKFLHRQNDRITLLLYKQEELLTYLDKPDVNHILSVLGYEEKELNNLLKVFADRFSYYMKAGGSFPHEMGILLGYPVADVKGFMEHEGKNFLYSGYWKVYSDLYGALYTFDQYKKAKEKVVSLVLSGMTIKEIMKHYDQDIQLYDLDECKAVLI